LISEDLLVAGDGLVTVNTAMGLQWLDLMPTIGLAYNVVAVGAAGWTGLGFHLATVSEIGALIADAGVPLVGGTRVQQNALA
jgi:hypothetical protein